jgi:hypothetical protein
LTQALTAKSRYERRATSDRQPFLDRARKCSELTIPTLIPPDGRNKTTQYHTPWQGIGARGVNNLASKLLLSLFPPNSPFFRLVVDDFTKDKMAGAPDFKSKVDEGLAKIERAVQAEIEATGVRNPVFLALKQLIVGGNTFLYLPAEGGIRVYPFDSFVVARDPIGNVIEAITKEVISEDTAPDDILALLDDGPTDPNKATSENTEIEIYTRFYRDGRSWRAYQEVNARVVPGTEGRWPIDKPPFMALRWTPIQGEDYGRSYVEEYLGDLISLEGLSKAVVEAAAASAKVVFLVHPNGTTRAKDITEAESGDAVSGHKDDVDCLQTEKQADLQIASRAIEVISERLSYAFLMHSAVQRKGERVTAEEIRYMAGELEDALGGVYSIFSQDLQVPFVVRLMARMTKQKRLPALPDGVVKPAIVTGLEALGRGHDLNKLNIFFQQVVTPLGPAVAPFINYAEALARGATALGIDPAGLIKTQDQVMQEQAQQMEQQQQQQMMDIAGKAAPAAVKAISDNLGTQG